MRTTLHWARAVVWTLLLSAVLCPLDSWAHNGKVGVIRPLTGIVVDGDLSDWPEDLERFSVEIPLDSHGAPVDSNDFRAWFMAGYDREAGEIYVAVEVHDDAEVVLPFGQATWNNSDGIELYVDFSRNGDHAQSFQMIGTGRVAFEHLFQETPWTGAQIEATRGEGIHQYECVIAVDGRIPDAVLRDGQWLPFDLVVKDMDPDGSFSWVSWGPEGFKPGGLDRMGVLALSPDGAIPPVERLEVVTVYEETDEPSRGVTVRAEPLDVGGPTSGVTDEVGRLTLEVPRGRYMLRAEKAGPGDPADGVMVDLATLPSGHVARVEIAPVQGREISLGKGVGHWRFLGFDDGLADDGIFFATQDAQGRLWFSGFTAGLSVYDGSKVRNYTEEDGLLSTATARTALYGDTLWVAGRRGVTRVDLADEPTFTSVTIDSQTIGVGQDRRIYEVVAGSSGTVYAATSFSVLARQPSGGVESDGWVRIHSNAPLPAFLLVDEAEHLWFGSLGRPGVYHYDGSSASLVAELADVNVRGSAVDADQNLWLGSKRNGLVRYNIRTGVRKDYTTEDGLPGNEVKGIAFDAEGALWGITDGGIFRYDGKFWQHLSGEGVPRSLTFLMADREGYLWASTWGSGVGQYAGTEFTTYGVSDGLPSAAISGVFAARDGSLWMAARDSGVVHLSNGRLTRYDVWTTANSDPTKPEPIYRVLGQTQSDIVFETIRGRLCLFDGRTFHLSNEGFAQQSVGPRGDIWVSRGDGVGIYTPGNEIDYRIRDRAVLQVRHVHEGLSGDLYIGFQDSLLIVQQGKKTRIGPGDGLAGGNTEEIGEDRSGRIWVATSGGLSVYDGSSWKSYYRGQDLPTKVRRIHGDATGTVWFSTGSGALRFKDGVFQKMTRRDGLASNDLIEVASGPDGNVWFATSSGLTRYQPRKPSPPSISIDAVRADQTYTDAERVSVTTTTELIAFEFSGASLRTYPEAMIYRYRLVGRDEDWLQTTAGRIEYRNLPRGDYTFEVHAVDRDLTYSERPATVALSVAFPIQLVGLYTALGFAFVLVVWQTGRVVRRDRRLAETNRELEERATELTETNKALSDANNELFETNRQLQQDRAVERVRGEVQAMNEASDFERVLSMMAADLKGVGVPFDTCGIDVLSEPVQDPTFNHFERNGFHYANYTIQPDGGVTVKEYRLTAPFPDVIEQTIHRFLAGEPWQALIEDRTTILEVPAGAFGRLRLTSDNRERYSPEEIEALEEFAAAVALGYARYLDIKEIQEQTERKSAFLAAMSHELRTPMNAIKGFTNLVLRRAADVLPDQQKENLRKVDQASDHLLAQINDLLDLSKIEAGRMDVSVAEFDVREAIQYCVSTVSPLVQEGVELSASVDASVSTANTDEQRVRQMVINLLSNAVKFTDEGSVTVNVRRSKEPEGVPSSKEEAQSSSEYRVASAEFRGESQDLIISVSDTGKGIPEAELPTLFDEYRQVSGQSDSVVQKGTGLGLSITKKFAELLGGTIEVESEVGRGSTFTVRIPAIYQGEDERP